MVTESSFLSTRNSICINEWLVFSATSPVSLYSSVINKTFLDKMAQANNPNTKVYSKYTGGQSRDMIPLGDGIFIRVTLHNTLVRISIDN
jgi:hypothetical protein